MTRWTSYLLALMLAGCGLLIGCGEDSQPEETEAPVKKKVVKKPVTKKPVKPVVKEKPPVDPQRVASDALSALLKSHPASRSNPGIVVTMDDTGLAKVALAPATATSLERLAKDIKALMAKHPKVDNWDALLIKQVWSDGQVSARTHALLLYGALGTKNGALTPACQASLLDVLEKSSKDQNVAHMLAPSAVVLAQRFAPPRDALLALLPGLQTQVGNNLNSRRPIYALSSQQGTPGIVCLFGALGVPYADQIIDKYLARHPKLPAEFAKALAPALARDTKDPIAARAVRLLARVEGADVKPAQAHIIQWLDSATDAEVPMLLPLVKQLELDKAALAAPLIKLLGRVNDANARAVLATFGPPQGAAEKAQQMIRDAGSRSAGFLLLARLGVEGAKVLITWADAPDKLVAGDAQRCLQVADPACAPLLVAESKKGSKKDINRQLIFIETVSHLRHDAALECRKPLGSLLRKIELFRQKKKGDRSVMQYRDRALHALARLIRQDEKTAKRVIDSCRRLETPALPYFEPLDIDDIKGLDPVFIRLLKSKHLMQRDLAVTQLLRLKVVDPLLDPRTMKVQFASKVMDVLSDGETTIEKMIPQLDNRSALIRHWVAATLIRVPKLRKQLSPEHRAKIEELLITGLGSPEQHVRDRSSLMLVRFPPMSLAVEKALVGRFFGGKLAKHHWPYLLESFARTPGAYDRWWGRFGAYAVKTSKPEHLRLSAIRMLDAVGQRAVGALNRAARDKSKVISEAATRALGEIKRRGGKPLYKDKQQ